MEVLPSILELLLVLSYTTTTIHTIRCNEALVVSGDMQGNIAVQAK